MSIAHKSRVRAAFNLGRTQRWVQHVITHPDGAAAGVGSRGAKRLLVVTPGTLEQVIKPSKQMSSIERIAIYSAAYSMRLIEALEKDYGCVRHALGRERFEELAACYLTAHPSTHYSLNFLGAAFPEFLRRKGKTLAHRRFISELARLEWAIQEVFDERQAEPLSGRDRIAIPSGQWNGECLRTIPALRLFCLSFPVNRYLQAVYDGRHMDIPAAQKNWLLVYRKNFRVWRATIDREQFMLLSAMHAGKSLGKAVEECASLSRSRRQQILSSVAHWFREWTHEGILCRESSSQWNIASRQMLRRSLPGR